MILHKTTTKHVGREIQSGLEYSTLLRLLPRTLSNCRRWEIYWYKHTLREILISHLRIIMSTSLLNVARRFNHVARLDLSTSFTGGHSISYNFTSTVNSEARFNLRQISCSQISVGNPIVVKTNSKFYHLVYRQLENATEIFNYSCYSDYSFPTESEIAFSSAAVINMVP